MKNFTINYIHPNKGNRSYRYILVVDTETIREEVEDNQYLHKFRFCWAVFARLDNKHYIELADWRYFDSADSFWDWVEDIAPNKHTLHIFAHNAQFDLHILGYLDELYNRGWKNITHIDEYAQFLSIWVKNGKRLEFIDTLNYFRMPLKELGDKLGIPKMTMPDWDDPIEKWSEYCKNDVLITFLGIAELIRAWKNKGNGNFRPTIASCAFNFYRHKYMNQRIQVHHNDDVIKIEESAYYGGRVLVLQNGEFEGDRYYQLDINSMYPYVMMTGVYPVKLIQYKETIIDPNTVEPEFLISIIADVELEAKNPFYPTRIKNRVEYPTGPILTTLCGPEILYAHLKGELKRIFRYAKYQLAPIFYEFVHDCYNLRLLAKSEGDKVYDLFWKLIMNSLYGKFAQRNPIWIPVTNIDIPTNTYTWLSTPDGQFVRARNIAGRVEAQYGRKPTAYYAPRISAYVTSYARVYLNSLFTEAGIENVFYSDTDSLIVNEEGKIRLTKYINPEKLGMLKIEKEGDKLTIMGKKHYILGDKAKRAGISDKAVQIDEKTFLDLRIEHPRSALRAGRKNTLLEKWVAIRLLQ